MFTILNFSTPSTILYFFQNVPSFPSYTETFKPTSHIYLLINYNYSVIKYIKDVLENMRKHRGFNTKIEVLNAIKDKRDMKRNTKRMSLRVLRGKGEG